MTATWTYV